MPKGLLAITPWWGSTDVDPTATTSPSVAASVSGFARGRGECLRGQPFSRVLYASTYRNNQDQAHQGVAPWGCD